VILEEMERGATFEDGVRAAQKLGITETDPSYDVDGWDAAVKVCALARVLMDAPLKLDDVRREGIRKMDAARLRAARETGSPYRLVARAERTRQGRVNASVRPEQIPSADAFASVAGTSLMIRFELDVLPALSLIAHGPDLQSTAYGLLADFINAVRTR
jgi:homoserine dehydrogenase